MIAFWKFVIESMLAAAEPRTIVEVSAGGDGRNTKNLLAFAEQNGCVLHIVDPTPGFDAEAWQSVHGETMVLHRARGLDALPEIVDPDAVLLDEDPNWYTVHRGLELLGELAERSDRPYPLTFVRNVSWPYARRDMYQDPEAIPEGFRHSYRKAGIVYGQAELSPERGINAGLSNAENEGTARNGVLSAVEDFMVESRIAFEFRVVHGFAGLGVLVPQASLAERPALRAAFDRMMAPDFLYQHTKRLERAHAVLHTSFAEQKRELRKAALRLERQAVRPGTPQRGAPGQEASDASRAAARKRSGAFAPARPLRVAFVGSQRLSTLLAPSCELTRLVPQSWKSALQDVTPDFVLVETADGRDPGPWPFEALASADGPLADLLRWCQDHKLPSALWATVDGASLAPFADVAVLCDHHFVADPEAPALLGRMIEADVPPGVLPFAAQPALHRLAVGGDRESGPLYVGGRRADWPASSLKVLDLLLHAARPRGLRIAVPAGEEAEFPAVFEDRIERVHDLEGEISLLQRTPVVIAFHPAVSAGAFVPRIAFEAPACGAAVIARPNWGTHHYFGDTIVPVRTPEEADEQLELLLSDAAARRERVDLARRFLEFGHTIDHRLATIASCVGLRRVPEQPVLQPPA